MATQSVSRPPAHGKTGLTGSNGSMPPPASPTLTNPDMILPDYPDTVSSPDRSHSPLMMWKTAHAMDMQQFDLNAQPYTGPVTLTTPTTPIIYGNGTMLSDIGEVTEAESIRGPVKHRNTSRNGHAQDEDERTTPTMPVYSTIKKQLSRERERRLSTESTSTITNGEQVGMFADFDDAVSVGDSNFQGDDEDSVAESYNYDDASMASSLQEDKFPRSRSIQNDYGLTGEDRYSTALSRRAEQILANAKRRLTTMEGNLSRARSSISSTESRSTPSPTMGRSSAAIHRDHDPSQRGYGHVRLSSENSIPTEFKLDGVYSLRAASALGAAGGYRQPLQTSRSADYIRDSPERNKGNAIYGNTAFAKSKTSLHETTHILEPLSEDKIPDIPDSFYPNPENTGADNLLSPTFGSFGNKELKRSASTTHMKDLKDQMSDLKGRLSTLRDQARADSLQRRSLSSLRTPSPFTNAPVDPWTDAGSQGTNQQASDNMTSWNGEMLDVTNDGNNVSPKDVGRIPQSMGEESVDSRYLDYGSLPQTKLDLTVSRSHSSKEVNSDGFVDIVDEDELHDDMKTEDGYQDEYIEGVDGYSDSGESSYHDTVQNQLSHEDREDAFDYEHFFLHSAMGTMSRRQLTRKGSRGSCSSDDSVETTRGPTTSSAANLKPKGRGRRGSHSSTSTMESFATATEGSSVAVDNTDNESLEADEDITEDTVATSERARSQSPETARRATFGFGFDDGKDVTDAMPPSPLSPLSPTSPMVSTSPVSSDKSHHRISVIRRPQSSTATFAHRPSVSSFDSTGTRRSFPLVNRTKVNGILTPRASPDEGLKQISESIMSETASVCESVHGEGAPIEMLQKEDQILVERLVASLGRCVLGLTESGRASAESRMYRRRIEMAKRMLEGLEQPT